MFAIIGFGCAGYHCLRALRESGCKTPVDVFSDTGMPPFNPMLSTYYAFGEISFDEMFPFGSIEDIQKKYPFNWYPDSEVKKIDAEAKEVFWEGCSRKYDKILISTGARPVLLPLGNLPLERIYSMRTVSDAIRLKELLDSRQFSSALVIGASMVGVKLACLLNDRGIHCTLSDAMEHVFPAAAFDETSEKIEALLRESGIDLRLGVKADKARVENGKAKIVFTDGSEAEADIVIQCIGTKPNTQLLDAGQVAVEDGIIAGEDLGASLEGIYAAGDCCAGSDLMTGSPRMIGLWESAALQGEAAGKNMAGQAFSYRGNIPHNITRFMDADFVSIGDKSLPGEKTVYLDDGKRFVIATVMDGKIQCVNFLNMFMESGVVKNHIMRVLDKNDTQYKTEMSAALYRGALPGKLIKMLIELLEEIE